MNELHLPKLPDELTKHLKSLHGNRKRDQAERKKLPQELRRQLTDDERAKVLEKTAKHCHLCGGGKGENSDGELTEERALVIDHIVPFASGGDDSDNNLLAAHGLCNGCRWFYSPEEFQWILRMGVWARKQMEDAKTDIGKKMRNPFLANEEAVRRRRKKRQQGNAREVPAM
jgi:5-methylcytosine-specific restriction endonuclease McrA